MEHPGGINPWRLKEKRFEVKIKEVPIGLPPKSVDEIVASFEKAITPQDKNHQRWSSSLYLRADRFLGGGD